MNSRYLQALGIPGLLGVGLLLFCASLYFSSTAPMQTQIASLKNEARKLAATLRASEPTNVPVAVVEPASDSIEIIRRLNAAAEASAVTVERASYMISEKNGMRRIEVSLPTKGRYLAIRAYLRDALVVGRNAQIESLALQRARATDTALNADLKLSFELDAK